MLASIRQIHRANRCVGLHRNLGYSQGFNLIEILIATLIIALMVGITIPYINSSNDKYAKQEMRRLLATIEMAKDLAVIENREYGLAINEESYQFLVLNDLQKDQPAVWEPATDHTALTEHQFSESVQINIAIDGENIFQLSEDRIEIFEEDIDIFENDEKPPAVKPPKIYFLSTGEQNQFVIAIAVKDDYQASDEDSRFYRVKGNLAGELTCQGPLPGSLFTDVSAEFDQELEERPCSI